MAVAVIRGGGDGSDAKRAAFAVGFAARARIFAPGPSRWLDSVQLFESSNASSLLATLEAGAYTRPLFSST
jgi:hypothetical protein